jgi:hypothetical protein
MYSKIQVIQPWDNYNLAGISTTNIFIRHSHMNPSTCASSACSPNRNVIQKFVSLVCATYLTDLNSLTTFTVNRLTSSVRNFLHCQ